MTIIKNNVFKFSEKKIIDVCCEYCKANEQQKSLLLLQHKSMFNKFYACKFNDLQFVIYRTARLRFFANEHICKKRLRRFFT